MPLSVQYILWDHDGVLVDTERWYFAATQQALADLDVPLDQDTFLKYMQDNISCWDLAKEAGYDDHDIAAQKQKRNVIYQEMLQTKPIEIPDVAQVLIELSATHRMAIVTTAKRIDFDLIHRDRHLIDPIEFVLSVEDYPNPKPHPDPYLAALNRFGAEPGQAVAIEDTSRGLRSAQAAGVNCIIIRNRFTASQDFTGAWAIVDRIRDIPLILAG